VIETPRDRLACALAPELLDALDAYIAVRIGEALAATGEYASSSGARWFTVDEGAAYLRVSVRSLERFIAGGRLRSTTLGRRRLLSRDDLDVFAAAGEETAPTAPPRRRRGVE
jgi:excisionase family DNA binding protein